jgi:hypothetical protein
MGAILAQVRDARRPGDSEEVAARSIVRGEPRSGIWLRAVSFESQVFSFLPSARSNAPALRGNLRRKRPKVKPVIFES